MTGIVKGVRMKEKQLISLKAYKKTMNSKMKGIAHLMYGADKEPEEPTGIECSFCGNELSYWHNPKIMLGYYANEPGWYGYFFDVEVLCPRCGFMDRVFVERDLDNVGIGKDAGKDCNLFFRDGKGGKDGNDT